MFELLDKPVMLDVPEVDAGKTSVFELPETLTPHPPPLRHQYPQYHSVSLCPVINDSLEITLRTVEDAVQAAPPIRERNDHQLFQFNRALLAVEQNTGEKLNKADKTKAFDLWHKAGLATKQLDPAKTYSDYKIKFFGKAAKANVPLGKSLDWDKLVAEVSRRPLPESLDFPDDLPMRRLMLLCRLLQEFWIDKPLFLGCRNAGKVIGVGKTQANAKLNALVGTGTLTLVAKGGLVKGIRQASRYRYNGELPT